MLDSTLYHHGDGAVSHLFVLLLSSTMALTPNLSGTFTLIEISYGGHLSAQLLGRLPSAQVMMPGFWH